MKPRPRDPTDLFTDRVECYARFRPGYPAALLQFFQSCLGLAPHHVVADVGSGTGILTQLFLENGNPVIGIEPNAAMRAAAEHFLGRFSRFRSVDGRAEATTLADRSVDLVVAGQAFHWFDPELTRAEVRRVLRPGAPVGLVWNTRRATGSPFAEAYERFLVLRGTDYQTVRKAWNVTDALERFFGSVGFEKRTFENPKTLDFEALKGRLLSSSYAPAPGDPGHGPAMAELWALFDDHAHHGVVTMEYDTELYFSTLSDVATDPGLAG